MKNIRLIEYLKEECDKNKKDAIKSLSNELDLSKEEVEAFVWDYVCTEEGWDNIYQDIERQIEVGG